MEKSALSLVRVTLIRRHRSIMALDPYLSSTEAREQLGVSDSTWRTWRRTGRGPKCRRLPNGELRIRQSELDSFMDALDLV